MSLVRKISADPFLRHNAVFFVGSLFVAALNYAYHPVVSRLLSVEEFGEVSTIFSLTAQIGVLLGVFNMVAIHLTSNAHSGKGRHVLEDVYAVVFWVQVCALVVLLLVSPFLAHALQFQSLLPFLFLAFNTYVSLPYALLTSVLQGKREFTRLTLGSLMQSGGKLIFAVLLILLGGGVLGALGGLLVAQLLVLYFFTGRKISNIQFFPRVRPLFDRALQGELRYAGMVLIATGAVAMFYTLDTVLVKYFFDPDTAGEYSGIAVVARIVYFATASFAAVLLPSVTLTQSKRENYRLLRHSALLIVFVGGSALGLMSIFPHLIVELLLGAKYLTFSALLPQVALMMFFASLINLLFFFLLALRRYVLIPIALCGIVLLSIPTSVTHDSLQSIVNHFLFADVFVLILLAGYLIYDYFFKPEKTPVHHHSSL